VRHVRMLGLCLAVASAMSAVAAVPALAEAGNPENYKQCPLKDPLVGACTWGEATSGHYTVGPVTVSITNPIVFQGGLTRSEPEEFIMPANGQAVVPVAEPVAGEPLANVTPAEQKEFGWPATLAKSYENARITGLLGPGTITEVIEPAGVPRVNKLHLVFQEGTGIEAPVRIQGENKWLAKLGGKFGKCFIGSFTNPIVQHLTTGSTTSPLTGETLTGSAGSLEIVGGGEVAGLFGLTLFDNTYSVPAAQGCGGPTYEQYLDPVMDRVFGLPAAAGASVTELVGEFDVAGRAWVKEHLKH
jgi:hypothetical protein